MFGEASYSSLIYGGEVTGTEGGGGPSAPPDELPEAVESDTLVFLVEIDLTAFANAGP